MIRTWFCVRLTASAVGWALLQCFFGPIHVVVQAVQVCSVDMGERTATAAAPPALPLSLLLLLQPVRAPAPVLRN